VYSSLLSTTSVLKINPLSNFYKFPALPVLFSDLYPAEYIAGLSANNFVIVLKAQTHKTSFETIQLLTIFNLEITQLLGYLKPLQSYFS
jgi:hypothetical protein